MTTAIVGTGGSDRSSPAISPHPRWAVSGRQRRMESFFSLLQKNVLDRRRLGHPRS